MSVTYDRFFSSQVLPNDSVRRENFPDSSSRSSGLSIVQGLLSKSFPLSGDPETPPLSSLSLPVVFNTYLPAAPACFLLISRQAEVTDEWEIHNSP